MGDFASDTLMEVFAQMEERFLVEMLLEPSDPNIVILREPGCPGTIGVHELDRNETTWHSISGQDESDSFKAAIPEMEAAYWRIANRREGIKNRG